MSVRPTLDYFASAPAPSVQRKLAGVVGMVVSVVSCLLSFTSFVLLIQADIASGILLLLLGIEFALIGWVLWCLGRRFFWGIHEN